MSILFWVEKHTYASTETPACWPKKGIDIKKTQLVWFLARQSTSHDQNDQVSGDLWRWENSWWFTAPETGPKSGNCGVEILGNKYFFILVKMFCLCGLTPHYKVMSFQVSIIAAVLLQMKEQVVIWWEGWWKTSRRKQLRQFLSVIEHKFFTSQLNLLPLLMVIFEKFPPFLKSKMTQTYTIFLVSRVLSHIAHH